MISTDTLSELFARDPMNYTNEDLDHIIEYYRDRRRDFNITGKKDTKIEKPKVDLADLGL